MKSKSMFDFNVLATALLTSSLGGVLPGSCSTLNWISFLFSRGLSFCDVILISMMFPRAVLTSCSAFLFSFSSLFHCIQNFGYFCFFARRDFDDYHSFAWLPIKNIGALGRLHDCDECEQVLFAFNDDFDVLFALECILNCRDCFISYCSLGISDTDSFFCCKNEWRYGSSHTFVVDMISFATMLFWTRFFETVSPTAIMLDVFSLCAISLNLFIVSMKEPRMSVPRGCLSLKRKSDVRAYLIGILSDL